MKKEITKQTFYRNLKGHKVRSGDWSFILNAPNGIPITGVFTGGIKGRQGGYMINIDEDNGFIYYTYPTTKYYRTDKNKYRVYEKRTNSAYWIEVID